MELMQTLKTFVEFENRFTFLAKNSGFVRCMPLTIANFE
jgi:hypothetical protein